MMEAMTEPPAPPTPEVPTEESSDPGASSSPEPAEQEPVDKEWWDDPRLPWKGKPGRADIACWTAIAIVGVYALVLLPLRPVILGLNPYALAALNGSRTATVAIGAQAALGDRWWPAGLVMGTLSIMKFDWIYWWAGRLWGHGLVEILAGKSKRAARNAARAESIARKIGGPAVILSYYIPIIPSAVIYASVGATGMRLWRFLVLDLIGAFSTRIIFMALGYRIGAPAIEVVKVIAKYSWYFALATIGVMIIGALWRRSRKRPDPEGQPASTTES